MSGWEESNVRNTLVRLARSKALRFVGLGTALISGVDDLVEIYAGYQDLFGLDVAHGVVFTALTGLLDPLAKLVGEDKDRLLELRREEKRTRE